MILVPGTSANPSSAALPVSPEVATRIQAVRFSPIFFSEAVSRWGSIWSAMSLNAQVGPCHSSRICLPSPRFTTGAVSGAAELLVGVRFFREIRELLRRKFGQELTEDERRALLIIHAQHGVQFGFGQGRKLRWAEQAAVWRNAGCDGALAALTRRPALRVLT